VLFVLSLVQLNQLELFKTVLRRKGLILQFQKVYWYLMKMEIL